MDGYVNKRAKKIWNIVTKRNDIPGAVVVDIGCGPGDFLRLALKSKAQKAVGIDSDWVQISNAKRNLVLDEAHLDDFVLFASSIEELMEYDSVPSGDVCLCFSVLPYVNDMEEVLRCISSTYPVSFIECQYANDGPGVVSGDDEMIEILVRCGFNVVEKIGFTDVEIRDATRSIWRCESER